MNKFENIKVNDTIFIIKAVRYGFNSEEHFFVPKKVIKVTPTQFVIEGGDRYRKTNGRFVGKSTLYGNTAYKAGEKYRRYFGTKEDIVTDETKKKEEFEEKLRLENKINYFFDKTKIEKNSKLSIKELKLIRSKLSDIEALITKSEEIE